MAIYIDPDWGGTESGTKAQPYSGWNSMFTGEGSWTAGESYYQKAGTTDNMTPFGAITVGTAGIIIGSYTASEDDSYAGSTRAKLVGDGTDYMFNIGVGDNFVANGLDFQQATSASGNSILRFGLNSIITLTDCVLHDAREHITEASTATVGSLTVRNCEFYNSGVDSVLLSGGCSSAEFDTCHWHDNGNLSIFNPSQDDCIQVTYECNDLWIHDCIFDVSDKNRNKHCITLSANNAAGSGVTIENNQFIGDSGLTNTSNGIVINDTNISDIVIRENIFTDLIASNAVTLSANAHVYGNIITNCGRGLSHGSSEPRTNDYTINFYNNTIVDWVIVGLVDAESGGGTVVVNFKNNILINGNSEYYYDIPAVTVSNGNTLNFDYNVFNSEFTDCFSYNGSTYSTLSAFSSAASTDDNSVVDDPELDTNYKPTIDSPTIEVGTTVNQFSRDYNGRPFKIPPTIGAYEVTSGFPAQTRTPRT